MFLANFSKIADLIFLVEVEDHGSLSLFRLYSGYQRFYLNLSRSHLRSLKIGSYNFAIVLRKLSFVRILSFDSSILHALFISIVVLSKEECLWSTPAIRLSLIFHSKFLSVFSTKLQYQR